MKSQTKARRGGVDGASVLVTSGTRSSGKRFVARRRARDHIKRLVVVSRNELKQSEKVQTDLHRAHEGRLDFFLSDGRGQDRFRRAMENIDTVVNAAALKKIPASGYNPMEFVKTNILGTQSVVDAPLDTGAKRVAVLSTGKEAAPITDIAKATASSAEHQVVSIRPGEKIHEAIITPSNSFSTVDFSPYSSMLPSRAVPAVSVRRTTNRGRRGSRIRSKGGRSDERRLNPRKSRDGRYGPGPSLDPTESRIVDASRKILSRRRMTKALTP